MEKSESTQFGVEEESGFETENSSDDDTNVPCCCVCHMNGDEEEGEGEGNEDESDSGGDETDDIEHCEVPTIGVSYGGLDEVYNMLQKYAKSEGFSFVKFSDNLDKNKEIKSQLFACNRAGGRTPSKGLRVRKKPTTRCDCRVRVGASRQKDGRWMVKFVRLEHNHEMSPSFSRQIKQHRSVSSVAKRLEYNDECGIRPSQNVNAIAAQYGGRCNMPCSGRDCRNHLARIRRARLKTGDANALHQLFLKMKELNHDFYFEIDSDVNRRLRNVFWVDGRSRAAYSEFHDVITFDTTYLLNKFKMPFAPFVGVNHHGQSILFGCALISRETVETFEWVFRAFLRAMGDTYPQAVITDQCQSIFRAIANVFTQARHRYCLWHICVKFPEKVKGFKFYDALYRCFNDVVYDCVTVEEFDQKWEGMIKHFKLERKGKRWEWFKALYNCREKWAPVYVRDQFWAGMSSTQRSESVNAYFKGYVHSKTGLKSFVETYEIALANKFETEESADAACLNSSLPNTTSLAIEATFGKVYTHNIFRKVQEEIESMMYCEIDLLQRIDEKYLFKVTEIDECTDGSTKDRDFCVSYNSELVEVRCICNKWILSGLLCRHAMKVLHRMRVVILPEKYISRRWRRDVVRPYTKVKLVGLGGKWTVEHERQRKLEKEFYLVADRAIESEDKFKYFEGIIKGVGAAFDKEEWLSSSVAVNDDVHGEDPTTLQDPLVVKTRGRPSKGRMKSRNEQFRGGTGGGSTSKKPKEGDVGKVRRSRRAAYGVDSTPEEEVYNDVHETLVHVGGVGPSTPMSLSSTFNRMEFHTPSSDSYYAGSHMNVSPGVNSHEGFAHGNGIGAMSLLLMQEMMTSVPQHDLGQSKR